MVRIEYAIVISDDGQWFERDVYHDGQWVRCERLERIHYPTPPRTKGGR